jgi:RNA polymerase sigma factor (sigma-70 family)
MRNAAVPEEPSFEDLLGRLDRGDRTAAEDIFRRYARRLIALARHKLDGAIRRKVDPEDVVQSALRSFFCRYAEGQYDLDDWDSLWSLLTVITLRKCGYRIRHFRTESRDVRREQADAGEETGAWAAIAREPTPMEGVLLAEAVEQLFRGLDEIDRKVLELCLQGCQAREAAAEVGVSQRTVYRLLERVKGRLERMARDAPAG